MLEMVIFLFLYNAGAVPKRILETMDMPGLTRENVASHLQVCLFDYNAITILSGTRIQVPLLLCCAFKSSRALTTEARVCVGLIIFVK